MASRGGSEESLWTAPYALSLAATLFLFIPYALFLPVLPLYILEELHGSFAAAGSVNAVFLTASVLFRTPFIGFDKMFLLLSPFALSISLLYYFLHGRRSTACLQ